MYRKNDSYYFLKIYYVLSIRLDLKNILVILLDRYLVEEFEMYSNDRFIKGRSSLCFFFDIIFFYVLGLLFFLIFRCFK